MCGVWGGFGEIPVERSGISETPLAGEFGKCVNLFHLFLGMFQKAGELRLKNKKVNNSHYRYFNKIKLVIS